MTGLRCIRLVHTTATKTSTIRLIYTTINIVFQRHAMLAVMYGHKLTILSVFCCHSANTAYQESACALPCRLSIWPSLSAAPLILQRLSTILLRLASLRQVLWESTFMSGEAFSLLGNTFLWTYSAAVPRLTDTARAEIIFKDEAIQTIICRYRFTIGRYTKIRDFLGSMIYLYSIIA